MVASILPGHVGLTGQHCLQFCFSIITELWFVRHWIGINQFPKTGCLWRTAPTRSARRGSSFVMKRLSDGFTNQLNFVSFEKKCLGHIAQIITKLGTGWESGFQLRCCISSNSKGYLIPHIIKTRILLDSKVNLRAGRLSYALQPLPPSPRVNGPTRLTPTSEQVPQFTDS